MTSCHIQAGHADSPVILHVPHASRSIPDTVRAGILLSNDELQLELDESTDTATDHIAIRAAELLASGRPRPWLAINQISRLVIDPERFPGDDEPMNAVGRGAVYTRTCNRALLRLEPAADAQRLMDSYYQPYTAALTGLVDDRIATTGAASSSTSTPTRDTLPDSRTPTSPAPRSASAPTTSTPPAGSANRPLTPSRRSATSPPTPHTPGAMSPSTATSTTRG